MANTKFRGRMVVDATLFPFTQYHLNYVQGWLTQYASEHPEHRNCIAIVTIISLNAIDIELYHPGDAIVSHTETQVPHPPVLPFFGAPTGSEEDDEDALSPKFKGFKPPKGEA